MMPTLLTGDVRRRQRRRRVLAAALGALLVATVAPASAGREDPLPLWGSGLDVTRSGEDGPQCAGEVRPASSPSAPSGPAARVALSPGGDLAFVGDLAVQLCGNDDGDITNDGFVVLDISEPDQPEVVGRFACTASASDLAVVGDLVFLAVDRNFDEGRFRGPEGEGCAAPTRTYGEEEPGVQLFKGFRVVDIGDPARPRLVANVPLPSTGGAHTVTAVPEPGGRGVLVFASAPAGPRSRVEQHRQGTPEPNSWLVRVPVHAPQLWAGRRVVWGDLTGCHDVTLFMPPDLPPHTEGRAVCSNVEDGSTLVDLLGLREEAEVLAAPSRRGLAHDPWRPQLLARLPVGGHVRHQSAAFSWDGRTLVISNESFLTMGGVGCAPTPQPDLGGLSFYDLDVLGQPGRLVPDVLVPVAHQAPPAVVGGAWCTAANFNVVPTRNGRDVLVASWYAGGTSVVQFDREPLAGQEVVVPRELASFAAFDPANQDQQQTLTRGSYWYRGRIWVGNQRGCLNPEVCWGGARRGIDVLVPTPRGALDRVLQDRLPDGARPDVPLPDADMGRQTCRREAGSDGSAAGSYRCS